MASLPFLFGSAFVVGLSGAMMPGPVLVATINRSARMGFKAGPLVVLGHGIIEVGLIAAVLAGLGEILQREAVMNAILVGGGLMLLALGAMIAHEVRTGKAELPSGPDPGQTAREESALRPVLEGIVTSASNPYWMLWWATIGLAYIAMAWEAGPLGLPAFYSGHILSDLAWFSLISAGVATGTRHINDVVYRMVLVGCSIFLVLLGIYFLGKGLSSFMAWA